MTVRLVLVQMVNVNEEAMLKLKKKKRLQRLSSNVIQMLKLPEE